MMQQSDEDKLAAMRMYRADLVKKRWQAEVAALDAEIEAVDLAINSLEGIVRPMIEKVVH